MGNVLVKEPGLNPSQEEIQHKERMPIPPPPEPFRYPDNYYSYPPNPPRSFEPYPYGNPYPYPNIPPNSQIYSPSRRTISRPMYPYPLSPAIQYSEPPVLRSPSRDIGKMSPVYQQIYSPSQRRTIVEGNYEHRTFSPTQRPISSLAHPLPISSNRYLSNTMRKTGQPIIIREEIQSPSGRGTRTIIEEPFEIDQPPSIQKIRKIVNRPISIPQPPETQIIEEVIESPITIHPPPQRRVVREVVERPVSIPQPPERRIVREVFKRPIEIQPPPEKRIVHDVIRKSILVDQPPKSIMIRKEFEEEPIFFENERIEPDYRGSRILQSYSIPPVEQFHPSRYTTREVPQDRQIIHQSPLFKQVDVAEGYIPQISNELSNYPKYVGAYPYEQYPVQYSGYREVQEIGDSSNQEASYKHQPQIISTRVISSSIPEVQAEQEKLPEVETNEEKNLNQA